MLFSLFSFFLIFFSLTNSVIKNPVCETRLDSVNTDRTSTITCQNSSYTMTGCGVISASPGTLEGVEIQSSETICAVGENDDVNLQAAGRCCTLHRNLNCFKISVGGYGTGTRSTTCPGGYELLSCFAYGENLDSPDGTDIGLVGIHAMDFDVESLPTGQNLATFGQCVSKTLDEGHQMGAYCCSDSNPYLSLTCVHRWSNASGINAGDEARIKCDSSGNYVMTGCHGWSVHGNHSSLRTFYIDDATDECVAVTDGHPSFGVKANAVCCSLDVTPTDAPTLTPTAGTSHPSTPPTMTPSLNPTENPSASPVGYIYIPHCETTNDVINNDKISEQSCKNSSFTAVGCGLVADGYALEGSDVGTGLDKCTVAENDGDDLQAYTRCCMLHPDLICVPITVGGYVTGERTLSCSGTHEMVSCDAFGEDFSNPDGSPPGFAGSHASTVDPDTLDSHTAYPVNGDCVVKSLTAGIRPSSVCCSTYNVPNLDLTCVHLYGDLSGTSDGAQSTVSCPNSNYFATGCSAWADTHDRIKAFYINDATDECVAVNGAGGTGVRANIVCCSINVIPTNSPTQFPTDVTTHPTIFTDAPSNNPTINPTKNPSLFPTNNPSKNPTINPTKNPTFFPTNNPSENPSSNPSKNPSDSPSDTPTTIPTFNPSVNPTRNPSNNPTTNPSVNPTKNPSLNPSQNPSTNPTGNPSDSPSDSPSVFPTKNPSLNPSNNPTVNPSANPSSSPSNNPTVFPTNDPSVHPTQNPSNNPSTTPTKNPSTNPTIDPTNNPSTPPTKYPSKSPIIGTAEPTVNTNQPSNNPTIIPTNDPSTNPTINPSNNPSINPSNMPSNQPSINPTSNPSQIPSLNPSNQPSINPTLNPSNNPSVSPTNNPSAIPTNDPTRFPIVGTHDPSITPTLNPSMNPTLTTIPPTDDPTFVSTSPTQNPTALSTNPTSNPTLSPNNNPSITPSLNPTNNPTISPNNDPTLTPSINPTNNPSLTPTITTISPTKNPTDQPLDSFNTDSPTKDKTSNDAITGVGGINFLTFIISVSAVGGLCLCCGLLVGIWCFCCRSDKKTVHIVNNYQKSMEDENNMHKMLSVPESTELIKVKSNSLVNPQSEPDPQPGDELKIFLDENNLSEMFNLFKSDLKLTLSMLLKTDKNDIKELCVENNIDVAKRIRFLNALEEEKKNREEVLKKQLEEDEQVLIIAGDEMTVEGPNNPKKKVQVEIDNRNINTLGREDKEGNDMFTPGPTIGYKQPNLPFTDPGDKKKPTPTDDGVSGIMKKLYEEKYGKQNIQNNNDKNKKNDTTKYNVNIGVITPPDEIDRQNRRNSEELYGNNDNKHNPNTKSQRFKEMQRMWEEDNTKNNKRNSEELFKDNYRNKETVFITTKGDKMKKNPNHLEINLDESSSSSSDIRGDTNNDRMFGLKKKDVTTKWSKKSDTTNGSNRNSYNRFGKEDKETTRNNDPTLW